MKIQCDVCTSEEASVFCCADEAVLCGPCDKRVHCANKLAGKHRRFALITPTPSHHIPCICDICKEKRGLLFCQQDRAILCRDCDVSIHNANIHTMKHSRFVLTGVRLNSTPIVSSETETLLKTFSNNTEKNQEMNSSSSSIKDYLINMLPGWHVEDLLFDDTTNMSLTDSYQADEYLAYKESSSSSFEGLPIWVPNPTPQHLDEGFINFENCRQVKLSRHKRQSAEGIKVPEFQNEWNSTKRSRNFLY